MMKKTIFTIAMFMIAGMVFSVETENIRLTSPENGRLLVHPLLTGWKKQLYLVPQMLLGPGEECPALTPQRTISGDKELNVCYDSGKFQWEIRFVSKGTMILANSKVRNLTAQELWLEPSFSLKLPSEMSAKYFWNGFNDIQTVKQKTLSRQGIKGVEEKHVAASTMPFPAAAVGGDDYSVFQGNVPFDLLSYSSCFYNPAQRTFNYALRVVVPPKKSIEFRQLIGSSRTDYGFQEMIVQQFYESFPECFAPVGGQDNPYIWGNHGQYLNWWETPDPEISRRLGVTLEWTYCPYKRSGDTLGRPEYWNYEAYHPFSKPTMAGQIISLDKISLLDFRKLRKEKFLKYGKRFGLMFYNAVSGTWCEDQLAHKYYQDALTTDPDVTHTLFVWSTHHDKEVRVFPMGTSFAKTFFEDLEILVDELKLPGFAMDCAYGGAYYRGPAIASDLPGKAWDSKGVFIDQSVAVNQEVNWIHNLKKAPSEKLTCFINGYLKGDYVMMESSYVQTGKIHRWMPLLRWYIGPRPGCVHGHGYHFPELVPDWRNKTQKEFLEIMGKLTDFIIMNQLQYGLTESPLTGRGCPQLCYVQPEAWELMRSGWQATVPAIPDKGMRIPYLSRYGRDANTYFFFGNSGTEEQKGNISFDSSALNSRGDSLLFVQKYRKSSCTLNQIRGKFTSVNAVLPSRVPVIYEAVAALQADTAGSQWEISANKTLSQQTFLLKYLSGRNISSRLKPREIHRFRLEKVMLDGHPIHLQNKHELRPGSQIELVYRSRDFNVDEKAITSFPFTDQQNKVALQIRIPHSNQHKALKLAGRFNEYFAFCRTRRLISQQSPTVKIITADQFAPCPGMITLQIGEQPSGSSHFPEGISKDSAGGLVIRADNEKRGAQLINELFSVMDRRFKYIFPFKSVMGLYDKQLIHFNTYGTSLPYQEYFEEAQK